MKFSTNYLSLKIATFVVITFSVIIAGIALYNNNVSKTLYSDAEDRMGSLSSSTVAFCEERINSACLSLGSLGENIAASIGNDTVINSLCSDYAKSVAADYAVFIPITQVNSELVSSLSLDTQLLHYMELVAKNKKPYVFFDDSKGNNIITYFPVRINQNSDQLLGIIMCSSTVESYLGYFCQSSNPSLNISIIFTDVNKTAAMKRDGDKLSIVYSEYHNDTLLSARTHDYTSISDAVASAPDTMLSYSNNEIEYYTQFHVFDNISMCLDNWILVTAINKNTLLSTSNEISGMGISLAITIIVVFIIVIVITVVILYYSHNNQVNIAKKLILERERLNTLIVESKWNIWEYDHATQLINNITKNDEPVLIHQFRSQLIRESIVHHDSIPEINALLDDTIEGKRSFEHQIRLSTADGETYEWFEIKGITIFDEHNKPITSTFMSNNIHQQKKDMERLKTSSERDPLTNLFNLDTANKKLSAIIDNGNASYMHAFLIIDVDNFSKLTNRLGKNFANALLLDISSRLLKKKNPDDLVAHIDTDKFLFFMYNISLMSDAEEMANSIRESFAELHLGDSDDYKITASVGISFYPNNGTDFASLLTVADSALFISKKHGKNHVTVYQSDLLSAQDITDYRNVRNRNKNIVKDTTTHSVIDSDIIDRVVEIMFEAKEMDVSFNMAFSLIGNYYGIDQIGIAEYLPEEQVINTPYSWNSSAFERFKNQLNVFTFSEGEKFNLFKDAPGQIFYTNNIQDIDLLPSSFTDLVICSGLNGVFQCAINERDELRAYLFANIISNKPWTENEVSTLVLLTKILGGYFLNHRTQEDIEKHIKYDTLTGAYTLAYFNSVANKLIINNPETHYSLVYMDIDKFKLINDSFGFEFGDYVLKEIARIVMGGLYEDECFGRVDADKFVMLIKSSDKKELDTKLDEIFIRLSTIGTDKLNSFKLNFIAGVKVIEDYQNISQIIDRANIARKSILDRHKSTYIYFDEAMQSALVKQKQIEYIMDEALANDEFLVYYQPKFNVYSNSVCGSEALVRWKHDGAIINPGEFVPIFENNGFITQVDFYVFEQVCKTLKNCLDQGKKVYPVSVNFSRVHLKTNDIIDKLHDIVNKYGISPSLIEVEITESAFAMGDSFAPSLLTEIHNIGFKLSMDDFGSGLSSLNSLRKLPFEILKLDKDFFQHDSINQREKIVISNIVNLAKELDMEIIAEGIETETQVEFLREIGCPTVQGFFYSRPVPSEEFLEKYIK